MLPLVGIAIVILGFAFRANPLLVVVTAAIATGLAAGHALVDVIAGIRVATAGRLLIAYLALRQIASAFGLTSLGGHPQMVRPLLAPMAESAAERENGTLTDKTRNFIRAHAAAADNIGLFFGEDVFIAIGSILLIRSFLEQNGILVEPIDLAHWAIPTAIAAFIIHGARLILLDRRIKALSRSEEPKP